MGMYTHCRGWIEIEDNTINKDRFNDLMKKAHELSSRSDLCVFSTVFNMGSNAVPYIFIGGEIKNYDNDWDIFLNFLFNNLKIVEYNIETRYEEDDNWTNFVFQKQSEMKDE